MIIDTFLNKITMYKLVLWGLGAMAIYSILLAFFGVLPYGGEAYLFSLALLIGICWISNFTFGKIFNAPTNIESWIITALILYFITFPVATLDDVTITLLIGFLAIASKFIFTINKRHIFNPVAIAALIVSIIGFYAGGSNVSWGNVLWWVGTPAMIPFVALLGLFIVRKIRKFSLLFSFLGAALVTNALISPETILQNILSYPIIFFGTIMLTEPSTLPPRRKQQMAYGAIVGVLFIIPFNFGPFHSSPELALIVGNLFSYAFSLKRRVVLTLKEKKDISKNTLELSFTPDRPIAFISGQYLEWTVPSHTMDARGNRRYFTIASSPTELELKLGVKFYMPSSTFKTDLSKLAIGDTITAGQLSGDFIMPKDTSKKLVFIAGGIGVTPFRSMIKYLIDMKEKRNIILFYSVKTEDEIAYREVFTEAEKTIGLKAVYLVGNFLTEDIIASEVPDFKERTFYLSGPNVMVENYKKLISGLGVARKDVHTDYFPGF